MFIGVKYLVGACYVVICINLLSTLVGILEFPNLVKLPKFTSNSRKKRNIILYISSDRHALKGSKSIKSPFKAQHIKGYDLLPSTTLSQCLVGVETKANGLVSVGYSCRTMRLPVYQLITIRLIFTSSLFLFL